MPDSPPSSSPPSPDALPGPGPGQCFLGALMAGGLAIGLYLITGGIIQTFASHPLHTSNVTAQNISVAVRTLVIGISTLAMAVCGIASLGLLGLGIQTGFQRLTQKNE